MYRPEGGQAGWATQAWGDYDLPLSAGALVHWLLSQALPRCYWNANQHEWNEGEPTEFAGITYRPYFWGSDEEEDPIALLPNFVFEDVAIRWYEHPGRGMSANKTMTATQWAAWFDRCYASILAAEEAATEQRAAARQHQQTSSGARP